MKIHLLIFTFLLAFVCADEIRAGETGKSKVYYSMETSSLGPRRIPNASVVRRMVDNLVCAATGQPNPSAAWASLVKPTERVGIKVAASGGAVSGTHPAVVKAIAAGLVSAGVQPANIIVWDRNLDDLLAAGYSQNDPLYRLRWIDTATGYDKKSQVTAPVIGRLIWGDSSFGNRTGSRIEDILAGGEQLSSTSYFSKVLSHEVDKVINVPSLTDSFLTGINGALANMVLSNLDNWRRFTSPPDFGDPYLAEIYADAMIRDKVVLTILDGLVLQYAGGPFPNPGFLVDHHSIFASRDPVAIDATATRLVNENRTPSRLPALDKTTLWLDSAANLQLGKNREEDIDLVRIGAQSEPPVGFKKQAPSQDGSL